MKSFYILIFISLSLFLNAQNFEKSKFYTFKDKNYSNGEYSVIILDTTKLTYTIKKLTAVIDSAQNCYLKTKDNELINTDNSLIFNTLAPEFKITSQSIIYEFFIARNINLMMKNEYKFPVINLIVVKNTLTDEYKLIPLGEDLEKYFKLPYWYLEQTKDVSEQIKSYTSEKHFIYFTISRKEKDNDFLYSAIYYPTLDKININRKFE